MAIGPSRVLPIESRLAMGFYFSPRGGSSQVARALCRALDGRSWSPTLYTGSLGAADDPSNADRFFSGVRCASLDYSQAMCEWRDGVDPMRSRVPMHASFEDKPDVPDRIFFGLDRGAYQRQVDSWVALFRRRVSPPSVVHLHHLTPMHEAAHLVWPDAHLVTHLHGTELKMLMSARLGDAGDHPVGRVEEWVERIQGWAARSERLVVISPHDARMAAALLPVQPERVSIIPNGVDTTRFAPSRRTPSERMATWRRLLVTDPRGWCPGRGPGSIRYCERDLAAFVGPGGEPVPVVVFSGRFLGFKRLSLLIEAHHAVQDATTSRSVLVIVGGFPGEWEGEHPHDTVQRLGVERVFFVGWRSHDDLADALGVQ